MNIKEVKRIRKDVCKGCRLYENIDEDNKCRIPHKKNGHICPCSICLVKGVCEDVCDLIAKYNAYKGNPKRLEPEMENPCVGKHANEYFKRWDNNPCVEFK